MIAHKYHAEFVTIVLESFQVCYNLFSHRSAVLVDSTQSFFLWNCYKWHFWISIKVFWNSGQSVESSSSFETAGTNVVTEHQTIVYDDSQGLDWFFRSKYGIVIQFQFDVISRVCLAPPMSFARFLSWHAASGDSGSPQEAHRRTNLHHMHGASQLINCEASSRTLSTNP